MFAALLREHRVVARHPEPVTTASVEHAALHIAHLSAPDRRAHAGDWALQMARYGSHEQQEVPAQQNILRAALNTKTTHYTVTLVSVAAAAQLSGRRHELEASQNSAECPAVAACAQPCSPSGCHHKPCLLSQLRVSSRSKVTVAALKRRFSTSRNSGRGPDPWSGPVPETNELNSLLPWIIPRIVTKHEIEPERCHAQSQCPACSHMTCMHVPKVSNVVPAGNDAQLMSS